MDLEKVGVDIMRAHAQAAAADADGWLTPGQIAEYHHEVFGQYGLPARTFGGTPITGGLWEADVKKKSKKGVKKGVKYHIDIFLPFRRPRQHAGQIHRLQRGQPAGHDCGGQVAQ